MGDNDELLKIADEMVEAVNRHHRGTHLWEPIGPSEVTDWSERLRGLATSRPGWRWVPVEPTDVQLQRMYCAMNGPNDGQMHRMYNAALAASPEPPALAAPG